MKFHCSVFHISLPEGKMLESTVSVLLCDWSTLSEEVVVTP